ncbi:hypothetical protein [Taibaiella soli]|uniref:Uncharacterized protein n=1 Tax=Taibaiella soli TaxID=1649169 RepID=A0A2W2B013_9BACT|nr:hypothetical protein [Taibaiella soli]PZF73308.1 hypothetical protein DN068_09060 [Taibaiella soli]
MKVFFICFSIYCTCCFLSCRSGQVNDGELLAIQDSIAIKVSNWTKLAENGRFKELSETRQDLERFVDLSLPKVQRLHGKELQQQVLHHLEYLQAASPDILKPFEQLTHNSDNKEISSLADKINNFSKEEERINVRMDHIRIKLLR